MLLVDIIELQLIFCLVIVVGFLFAKLVTAYKKITRLEEILAALLAQEDGGVLLHIFERIRQVEGRIRVLMGHEGLMQ